MLTKTQAAFLFLRAGQASLFAVPLNSYHELTLATAGIERTMDRLRSSIEPLGSQPQNRPGTASISPPSRMLAFQELLPAGLPGAVLFALHRPLNPPS